MVLLAALSGCRHSAAPSGNGQVRPSVHIAVPHNLNEMVRFSASLANAFDTVPVISVLDSVRTGKESLDEFSELAGQVWNDPNSPLRNDEFYIPVLNAKIASGFYDEASVTRLDYQVRLMSQNRLGRKANDIVYTEKDGSTGYLYRLDSEYTLVYFNNPGCEMCSQLTSDLKNSMLISALVDNGLMKILSVYPDEDLDEWNSHYDEQPSSWIRCYDKGCRIREMGTYSLEAIPSLYLLDRNRRVIVKDASDLRQIEIALSQNLGQ